MISAGELNRRIVIQKNTPTTDTNGEKIAAWSNVATIWAHIQPLSGREAETARAFSATVTHKIGIRYTTAVTAEMRATYGHHVYMINAVLHPDETHDRTDLLATEIINAETDSSSSSESSSSTSSESSASSGG